MPTFTARLNRSMLLHHTSVHLCLCAGRCGRMWKGVGVRVGVDMQIVICLNMIKKMYFIILRENLYLLEGAYQIAPFALPVST